MRWQSCSTRAGVSSCASRLRRPRSSPRRSSASSLSAAVSAVSSLAAACARRARACGRWRSASVSATSAVMPRAPPVTSSTQSARRAPRSPGARQRRRLDRQLRPLAVAVADLDQAVGRRQLGQQLRGAPARAGAAERSTALTRTAGHSCATRLRGSRWIAPWPPRRAGGPRRRRTRRRAGRAEHRRAARRGGRLEIDRAAPERAQAASSRPPYSARLAERRQVDERLDAAVRATRRRARRLSASRGPLGATRGARPSRHAPRARRRAPRRAPSRHRRSRPRRPAASAAVAVIAGALAGLHDEPADALRARPVLVQKGAAPPAAASPGGAAVAYATGRRSPASSTSITARQRPARGQLLDVDRGAIRLGRALCVNVPAISTRLIESIPRSPSRSASSPSISAG